MNNNIFLTSDATTVLHDVVKHFDCKQKNKVLFVDTSGEACKEELVWIIGARKKLIELGFDVIDYTITGKTENEIRSVIHGRDVLYVAGGNNAYLLKKSQESSFANIVKDFIESGGVYIGQSAGSIVAGPSIYPACKPSHSEWFKNLEDLDGYGLVDFVVFPHFGRKDKKEQFLDYRFRHAYSEKYKIILLTDRQYIRVQENGMYKIEEI